MLLWVGKSWWVLKRTVHFAKRNVWVHKQKKSDCSRSRQNCQFYWEARIASEQKMIRHQTQICFPQRSSVTFFLSPRKRDPQKSHKRPSENCLPQTQVHFWAPIDSFWGLVIPGVGPNFEDFGLYLPSLWPTGPPPDKERDVLVLQKRTGTIVGKTREW